MQRQVELYKERKQMGAADRLQEQVYLINVSTVLKQTNKSLIVKNLNET